jgi:hypothetical protein
MLIDCLQNIAESEYDSNRIEDTPTCTVMLTAGYTAEASTADRQESVPLDPKVVTLLHIFIAVKMSYF